MPSLVEIIPMNLQKKISIFRQCIYNYLPFEKGGGLHLSELESPSPKDALCQVWLKLTQWFLRRFLNFVSVFSQFRYYLVLEKGVVLNLKKFKSLSPKDTLCQVWKKLTQWFWERRWICEKFTDGRIEGRRTTGDQKSSIALSAQVS